MAINASRVARAVEKGETNGFLKIHVEQASQIIVEARPATLDDLVPPAAPSHAPRSTSTSTKPSLS